MNNDRLKFRVWNKSKNRYITEDIASLYLYSDGKLQVHYHGQHEPTEINTNDAIIEFATGLRDINGNLIYSGDIVLNNDANLYEVFWADTELCWSLKNTRTGICRALNCFDGDDCEIIGNIHEQKEQ